MKKCEICGKELGKDDYALCKRCWSRENFIDELKEFAVGMLFVGICIIIVLVIGVFAFILFDALVTIGGVREQALEIESIPDSDIPVIFYIGVCFWGVIIGWLAMTAFLCKRVEKLLNYNSSGISGFFMKN